MSNVVITSGIDSVTLTMNNIAVVAGFTRSKWRKDALVSTFQLPNGAVVIRTVYKQDFAFSSTSAPVAGTMLVDSVEGVAPATNDELFHLLADYIN